MQLAPSMPSECAWRATREQMVCPNPAVRCNIGAAVITRNWNMQLRSECKMEQVMVNGKLWQDELADSMASTALLPTARSELDTAHDRGRRIEVPLSAPSPPPSLNPRPRNRTFCTLPWSVLVRVYTAQLHSRFSPQGLGVT